MVQGGATTRHCTLYTAGTSVLYTVQGTLYWTLGDIIIKGQCTRSNGPLQAVMGANSCGGGA